MIHSHTRCKCWCVCVYLFVLFRRGAAMQHTNGTTPRPAGATLYPSTGLRVFIKCCSLYHLSARQNYCRCVYVRRPLDGRTLIYVYVRSRQFVELNVFYCGSGEKEQAKLFESCTGALDTQRENIMNAICPRSRECWGKAETWTQGTWECGEFDYCNSTKMVHGSGFRFIIVILHNSCRKVLICLGIWSSFSYIFIFVDKQFYDYDAWPEFRQLLMRESFS